MLSSEIIGTNIVLNVLVSSVRMYKGISFMSLSLPCRACSLKLLTVSLFDLIIATDVVTVYVFQEPSLLSSLQDNGLTDVVLQALLVKEVSKFIVKFCIVYFLSGNQMKIF